MLENPLLGDARVRVGVGALVINADNQVLLLKRPSSNEFDPETWSQPGGRLVFGESPYTATIRKLVEEVGIKAHSLSLLTVHSHLAGKPDSQIQWISICYLCADFSGEPSRWEEANRLIWNWFPLTALPSPLTAYTAATIDSLIFRAKR